MAELSEWDAMLERMLKRAHHLWWTHIMSYGVGVKAPKMRVHAGVMRTILEEHIKVRREWRDLNEDNTRLRRRINELEVEKAEALDALQELRYDMKENKL